MRDYIDICKYIIKEEGCRGIKCGSCPLEEGEFDCSYYPNKVRAAVAYLESIGEKQDQRLVEGDTVLVSDNGREWVKRIFVLEYKGIYYAEGLEDNKQLVAWKYCTHLNKDT